MYEREAISRPRRRDIPITGSAKRGFFAPDAAPEQSADDVAAYAPAAQFDLGTISILPPQPQIGPEGGELDPSLANRIQEQRGGGAVLDPATRMQMESGLGHNFADVRVHADRESDVLNRSVGANAFTVGSDIFLSGEATSAGAYGGDQLLAHELTHVVQQRGAQQGGPLSVTALDDPEEREASAIAGNVSAGKAAGGIRDGSQAPVSVAPIRVQRDGKGKPPPSLESLSKDVEALKKKEEARAREDESHAKQDVIRDKKIASMNLDIRWHAIFEQKLASYEQAIDAITWGIQSATTDFQNAQAAQAQTDQLWAQVFAGAVALGFAFSFEWMFSAFAGQIGTSLSRFPKIAKFLKMDVQAAGSTEKWIAGKGMEDWMAGGSEWLENPANAGAAAAGSFAATSMGIDSTKDGGTPDLKGTDGGETGFAMTNQSVTFLAGNMITLLGHKREIEKAFEERAIMRDSVVYDWEHFDAAGQEKEYQSLLAGLEKSGSGYDKLKPKEEIAKICEKLLWAAWLKDKSDYTRMWRDAAKKNSLLGEDLSIATYAYLRIEMPDLVKDMPSLGSDIEDRLTKILVAKEAGIELSGHFYKGNSDDWGAKLATWAHNYKDTFAR